FCFGQVLLLPPIFVALLAHLYWCQVLVQLCVAYSHSDFFFNKGQGLSRVERIKRGSFERTVREELAAHKEEVHELRHMLTIVEEELAAVKEELAEHKVDMTGQKWAESSKASGTSRKRRHETRAEPECVRETEEWRKEVQELNRPCALEEGQMRQDLKLNVEVEIRKSKGDRRAAWQAIKSVSRAILPSTLTMRRLLHGPSDAMLGHVSTMTHLEIIDLQYGSGFSAEGMKHLYTLPRLEMLVISHTDILDGALEGIGSMVSLRYLYLQATNVTDAGLPHLTGLSTLKFLWLTSCKGVTNAGMVHVGRMTELENLDLDGTEVTDDGLHQLTALTNLRELRPPEGGTLRNNDVCRRIGRYQ
ncbi:unnamed protein product, partial [Closterium sp. NIES-53]